MTHDWQIRHKHTNNIQIHKQLLVKQGWIQRIYTTIVYIIGFYSHSTGLFGHLRYFVVVAVYHIVFYQHL